MSTVLAARIVRIAHQHGFATTVRESDVLVHIPGVFVDGPRTGEHTMSDEPVHSIGELYEALGY